MYQKVIKRLLDIVISLVAMVVLAPVYLVISVCVLIKMGSPILFGQSRMGKDEKEFIVKHFVYSLTINKYINKNNKIIDVGTGAGFPGIYAL